MLSEKAQKKYVFFEESNMKAVFDQPEAFEALVAAAGAAQQSGESFAVPQDLPEGVECGVVHVSESVSFVEVTPEEIDSDVVVIYYHGGGFIMEMGREHLVLCSVLAKEQQLPQPALLVPCSPFIDLTGTTEAQVGGVDDDPLISWYGSRLIAQQWGAPYQVHSFPPDPFYADKSGLAPMYLLVGQREVLKAGIEEYARQVEAAGGQVRLEVAEGLWHAFLLDALCDIPEVDLYVDKVLEAIGAC